MQEVERCNDRIEDHDDPQLDEPLPPEKKEDRHEKKAERPDDIDRISGKEPDTSYNAKQEPRQQFARERIQRADGAGRQTCRKSSPV